MENEIYPMPFFATISVANIEETAKWYQRCLGFTHIFTIPGKGGKSRLIHLRWRKYADLLIIQDTELIATPKGKGITLNFAMEKCTIDQFAEDTRSKGVEIVNGPVNQPWNTRELSVVDPNGFYLTFTEPINKELPSDDLIDKVQGHVS